MFKISRMPSGEPEIFRSLQGEGISAGTPSVFLRLATCNLACTWCDTKYTWDWQSYHYGVEVMTLSETEVYKRVVDFGLPHLVITGGEPMLQQKRLAPLASSLRERGFFCEVETNGTLVPDAEMVSVVSQWNVSPKTTSSGNPIGRRQIHQALEAFSGLDNAYFKFVILEVPDIDEVCHLVGRYDLPAERIILMPEGATPMAIRQREKWLAEACAERGFRYSTRLHIMLWGAQRGQ